MAKLLITGGTGFVGGYVMDALIEAGHSVRALVRSGEVPQKALEEKPVEFAGGDVVSGAGLEEAATGMDAVVHLVGIIRERPGAGFEEVHVKGTENMLRAAAAAKVRRFIHMSALGSRPDGVSRYHKTKWRAEEAVRASGIPYVIFRPSVIFGPGDEFINKLRSFYNNPFFVPVIGNGKPKLQPVYAKDVARCFASAVDNPAALNRAFELAGPKEYSTPQLLVAIEHHIDKKRVKLHAPIALVRPAAAVMERFSRNPQLTTDQLIMLQEDNIADNAEAEKTFGIKFSELEEILPSYIR